MAGKNDEPNWRSAAGGPARKGKQHGWQQEDPKSNVRAGTRRFKMLFLIGGGCAAAAGIVWLILLLMPGKRPGFLAIAADPREGIARLDVPYDPYGWISAQRLLKWMGEAGKDDHVPKVLAETPLWLDDQFDEWIEKTAADSNIDPVIVYIGLHGGVNADGDPILYTGRDAPSPVRESDRPAVQLSKILDKLEEKASKKRKVILLDVGRELPDPNLGEISNDFARAVKTKLGATIAKWPTTTVILAAGEGERAWNSAHLGMTALSYGLLQALSGSGSGSVGRDNMSSYRADELFEALQKDVGKWSKNNRPTAQTLQMLPPLDEWRGDEARKAKYAERKFFKPRAGAPDLKDYVLSDSKEATPDLREEWATASQLAARTPAPATYTPIAWRRYRELVLRLERAVLAGDTDGANVLKNTIRATRDDIERGLDLKLESVDYQLPLGASLGRPSGRSLDPIPGAAGLAEAAKQTLAALGNAAQRPVEAHLPIMLNRYAREVLKSNTDGPLATAWRPAATTRILAERAALGARANPNEFPYSERVWPLVAKAVLEGDEARRRGEDRLHGEADQVAASAEAFREADKKYREALAIAASIQEPLRLRDEAFGDLPFLARWLAEADESGSTSTVIDQANATMRELWTDAMELSRQIERAPGEPASLAKATESVRKKLAELRDLASERTKTAATADASSNWQTIEHLLHLPPPMIAGDDRLRLVERGRSIARKLAETDADFVGGAVANPDKIVRRMHAIAQSLGGEWATWVAARPDIPKYETTLKMSDANPYAKTPALMAAFAAQRQRQADFAKHPEGGPTERARAELFSRLAVPFSLFPSPEPATVNARRYWKSLLEGQARRIALDHWYSEAGQPYFTGEIAPKYLADARKLGEKLGERDAPKSPDEVETERLMAVKPLSMKCLDADAKALRWTTESDRTLRYALQTVPYGVPGEGVLAWSSDNAELLELNVANRKLVDLRKPIEGGGPQVSLQAGKKIEDAATGTLSTFIKASGYFRGQRLAMDQSTEVKINRKPDLVVTSIKPDRDAAFAIRTDREFSPGAVSILLDYSKSMERSWTKKGPSKKTEMIDVLADILEQLPPKTDLKIHAFLAGEKADGDRRETEIIFDYEREKDGFLNNRNGLIQKLTLKPVDGNTPLLKSMRETIANMKRNYSGNRTLIVLTDGADTSLHDEIFKDSKEFMTPELIQKSGKADKLIEAVQNELKEFDEDNLLVQMVVFGESDEEKDLARKMYEPIKEFKKTPGIVRIVDTKTDLAKQLAEAIRPKVQFLLRDGSAVPNFKAGGIPTNKTDQGPGQFAWRGFVRPDPYQFRHYQTRQEIDFEAGDAISVRLRRDPEGNSFFNREIYYRDVEKTLDPDRIDAGHSDWHLAVPEFGYANANDYFLISTAAIESKVATNPVEPVKAKTETLTTIKQVKPTFVWWELTRLNAGKEERFPGTVSVHNLQGQPAPSWRIVGNNGSKTDGLDNRQFRLRAWPRYNDVAAFGSRSIRATIADLRSGVTETIQDVSVRARLEKLPFVQDRTGNERLPKNLVERPVQCLVVRVDDKAGRRLQVKVDRKLDLAVAEHRYFYDRDDTDATPKIMAYTAVFGEVNEDNLARLGEIEIGLISVSEIVAAADERRKPLLANLKNPLSKPPSQEFVKPIDLPAPAR